jgi:trehalose utilization protein
MWRAGQMPMIFMLIVVLAVAVVFHSLTTEVDGNGLRWYFGPGLWTYRLAFEEILNVAVVRNHWWNGFGIRTAPGFRLYNVSGLDAVELQLKSGDIRHIDTDDPDGLAAALKAALRGG